MVAIVRRPPTPDGISSPAGALLKFAAEVAISSNATVVKSVLSKALST